ncbi:PREDICTED: short-chain dehydrogenase/reductase family 16C member 6-like [Ceratosolen solmsi marchali]|uniref:Short-chain dehydrogenase/reductase family 16C member 6-like n=1 Tax=Ceratosolen solmsi marchali TaxID=326594 RepID=A0AAJ6YGA9_9HYME|nr:PREDICTED: short-chain dehydrogenase/reductase family 16C member 6-like [Ceratosolen solmsi marchali]
MSWLRSTGDVVGFLLLSILAILESVTLAFIPKRYRMKNVAGEIALVTGGGSGLGRLISLRLAKLGAIVVVWDINTPGLNETVKMIQAMGGTCYGYVCDLCNREDVYKQASRLTKEVGRVSILVNNAGVVTGRKFLDSTDQMIIRTMDVNIMSHFWTVKAFLPAMLKENKGHIVSIASLAGHVGCTKLVDYTASKFAAVGFDEALRAELEAEGSDIKTTVICPYFIRSTGMFDDVMSRFIPTLSPDEVADRVITAMRCNERFAIIPSYLQVLLAAKWMFPWKCSTMLLRGLVHDASPKINPDFSKIKQTTIVNGLKQIPCEESTKEPSNGSVLHQQLTRRISSSERKP